MRIRRQRRQIVTRALLVLAPSALLIALLGGRAGAAGPQKDTPELVMQGAGESLAKSQSLTRGLAQVMQENNNFLQHLQSDRTYAAAFLTAGQKNDRAELVNLMKRYSPSGDIIVTQLNTDFTAKFKKTFKTDSGDVTIEVCISTDHGCSGGFASVVAK